MRGEEKNEREQNLKGTEVGGEGKGGDEGKGRTKRYEI